MAGSVRLKATLGRVRVNRSSRGKAVSVHYSECVFVALGIQHGTRMRELSGVACQALPNFSTLVQHKGDHIGKKNGIENELHISIFPSICVCNVAHTEEELSEIGSNMHIGLHTEGPLLLADFNET